MSESQDATNTTVIVGAGPYGLAVAAHLTRRGVPVRVFGEPMSSWAEHMPAGMFLKSEPSASTISAPDPGYTLADYCAATGVDLGPHGPVPIGLFVEYGRWFQERLVRLERSKVLAISQAQGGAPGFDVALDTGEVVRARTVVMAAGHVQFTYVPEVLRALAGDAPMPTDFVSHAGHHADLSKLGGLTVAVVGAGQSALESAALLHEAGASVEVLVRAPQLRWGSVPSETRSWRDKITKPATPLGPGWSLTAAHRGPAIFRRMPGKWRIDTVRSVLGPSGGWWLRPRVDGVIPVHLSTEIRDASIDGDKVVLSCGGNPNAPQRLVVDHVIAATGYRPAHQAISLLDADLLGRVECFGGYPVLDGKFASSVPGLYFAGLASAATFGPLMRFVCGTEYAAPRIARAVATRNERARVPDKEVR